MPKSDDIEWTPFPGERVPQEETGPIVAAFERRFRVCTEGRDPQSRTWVTFDPSDSRRADRRAFKVIAKDIPVLLYFEGRHLWRCKMGYVRRYLTALQPWEDEDLYVFDASLTWCIAFTHLQTDGRVVIVAGTFPPPKAGS
jgi:hypothetical protein